MKRVLRKLALLACVLAPLPAHAQPVGLAPSPFVQYSQYPTGSTPITCNGTGTTAATTCTLAAAANKFTFLCGAYISADATAATAASGSIVGVIGGTMPFRQSVAAVAAGTAFTALPIGSVCIQGAAVNTAIVITSAAAGTGGNTLMGGWGYLQ